MFSPVIMNQQKIAINRQTQTQQPRKEVGFGMAFKLKNLSAKKRKDVLDKLDSNSLEQIGPGTSVKKVDGFFYDIILTAKNAKKFIQDKINNMTVKEIKEKQKSLKFEEKAANKFKKDVNLQEYQVEYDVHNEGDLIKEKLKNKFNDKRK